MYFLAFFLFIAACVQFADPQVFNPIDYGAKGDGISNDTEAVRATLAAVAANKGGEVLFDSQFAFLTGCFNITSNVILNVKGTILASQDSSNYIQVRGALQWQSLVQANSASNITITGGGTIDGQGAPWWACLHRGNDSLHLHGPPCNGLDRPNLIMLAQTNNINIHNITLKDSPILNTHLHGCTNVHMSHITVLAPWDSPNTDGFDIDCSVNVLLEDSFYSGGDDAIAIGCGDSRATSSENVLIRNMTVERSHGLSIGSGTLGGVRNITFDHITGVYLLVFMTLIDY
uniref:Glycoside hydrolase family 28 n=1 Tax=Plectus sambesii TaxID=2011161 RepID=A0A914W8P7_9BILA